MTKQFCDVCNAELPKSPFRSDTLSYADDDLNIHVQISFSRREPLDLCRKCQKKVIENLFKNVE